MTRGLWLAVLPFLACTSKPDPARIRLLNHLRDGRPAVRIVAIQQLAPHANKEETAAIVRAAEDQTTDVRKAVALALAKVDADNAVDLAASFLRDRSDDVRAAAVSTLAKRGGSRAMRFIAYAYKDGGPRVRAAVAATGPAVLAQAVKTEASILADDRERRRKDSHPRIREEAIVDLGTNGTPSDIAELSARLVGSPPLIAAAACTGLAEARAVGERADVIRAFKSGAPEVQQACAYAVATLDPEHAGDLLAGQLESADPATASVLLDLLEEMDLSDKARESVCHAALDNPDGATALRAARLIGTRCLMASSTHPKTWTQKDVLRVWGALGRSDPALEQEARTLLSGQDLQLAVVAATYLGQCGTHEDASALNQVVTTQLGALDAARSQATEKIESRRQKIEEAEAKRAEQWRAMIGSRYDQLMKLNQPLRDKLLKKLGRTLGPDISDEYEKVPGQVDLIVAAATAAVRQGADGLAIAQSLMAEKDLRLRLLAVQLANELGPRGEALQAAARKDPDPAIQQAEAIQDLRRGDTSAIARLAALADNDGAEQRREIADVLATVAKQAVHPLIALTMGEDSAVPDAVAALQDVPGQEVVQALLKRLDDARGLGAREAIRILQGRSGPGVDVALERAAVHPNPDVRVEALRALTARHWCEGLPTLAALHDDYVGAVRTAEAAYAAACRPSSPPPGRPSASP